MKQSYGSTDEERPEDIEQAGPETLRITWRDGHVSEYPVIYLRFCCPCAHCVDEVTGNRRIDAGSIPGDVKPVHLESVGNYAINIEWTDGHDTGIYAFEYLRDLCPCEECRDLSIQSTGDLDHVHPDDP